MRLGWEGQEMQANLRQESSCQLAIIKSSRNCNGKSNIGHTVLCYGVQSLAELFQAQAKCLALILNNFKLSNY
jgi:hypothetical protein